MEIIRSSPQFTVYHHDYIVHWNGSIGPTGYFFNGLLYLSYRFRCGLDMWVELPTLPAFLHLKFKSQEDKSFIPSNMRFISIEFKIESIQDLLDQRKLEVDQHPSCIILA